jgi:addiction module HigA family antidote
MRITSTPGEILKEEYMVPHKLSSNKLAKLLDVSESALSRLISGKASLGTEMALRLGKVFGTTPMFWINLQTTFDISEARADKVLQAEIDKLKPFFKPSITENRTDAQIDS